MSSGCIMSVVQCKSSHGVATSLHLVLQGVFSVSNTLALTCPARDALWVAVLHLSGSVAYADHFNVIRGRYHQEESWWWAHLNPDFTCTLPCIIIDLFLNNQPDALIIQIYSVIKLYTFQASSLPIIRSSQAESGWTAEQFHPDCAWKRSSKPAWNLLVPNVQ